MKSRNKDGVGQANGSKEECARTWRALLPYPFSTDLMHKRFTRSRCDANQFHGEGQGCQSESLQLRTHTLSLQRWFLWPRKQFDVL